MCCAWASLRSSSPRISDAPKYFGRGDVIAPLAIGLVDAVLLLGASSGDSDAHRAVGVPASVSGATLFLATVSIPVLFAPLAIAGAFRLPRAPGLRRIILLLIPAAIVATAGLIFIGQSLVFAVQFRCPRPCSGLGTEPAR